MMHPQRRLGAFIVAALCTALCAEPAHGQAPPRRIEIGRPTGTLDETFNLVTSISELRDGRIIVSDDRDNSLYIGNFRSRSAAVLGRTGRGPREYSRVAFLWSVSDDSTFMQNQFDRRWLVLVGGTIADPPVPDLPWVRTAQSPGRRFPVMGFDHNGNVVAVRLVGTVTPPESLEVVRISRGTGRATVVTQVGVQDPPIRRGGTVTVTVTPGPPGPDDIFHIPFLSVDAVAVFPDGWIAVARNDPYRVDWCAASVPGVHGPTLIGTPPRLTDAAKQAYLNNLAANGKSIVTRIITYNVPLARTTGWSDRAPPFVERGYSTAGTAPVLPVPDGRLLVERVGTDGKASSQYDVIDRQGAIAGQIELPGNQRIVGFGRNTAYIARTDEDGLKHLTRHPWPKE